MTKKIKNPKQLLDSLKRSGNIGLSANEKDWRREKLIHFMEKHPVINPEHARLQLQKARPTFNPLQLIQSPKPMTAII
ncbi:MAG: hypothetical protein Q8P37_00880, partial [Candidatus Spechtbacteria bacterium]|nr:hypothetical protein [Candidatus Spechtbacteria bacterium]